MSYQEKRIIVSTLTGAIVLAAYCIFAFAQIQAGAASPDDLKFWARAILIFIGIGVAASIIIQIIFHILLSVAIAVKKTVQEGQCDDKTIEKSIDMEMVEDEMGKLIELKSMRFSFAFAGIGFIAALFSLLLNYSSAVMLNILYISFCIGSLCGGFAQLYFYKKGV